MATATRSSSSIGAALERSRLEHRARRIEQVLSALKERRDLGPQTGGRPASLDQAIAGFGAELSAVRAQLRRMH
jgi:hypothetical protein